MVRVFRELILDVMSYANQNDSISISHEAMNKDSTGIFGPIRNASKHHDVICHHVAKRTPFGIFQGENPIEFSFSLILLQVSFVIVVSKIVRILLKPLKQPRIISEIIGAVIVGPSVLCHNKKFAQFVFPGHSYYIFQNIGIMGLMYYMFISGVKLDLMTMKKSSKSHWIIALAGVLIPIATTLTVAGCMRDSFDEEMRKGSSILGVAVALGITPFPVLHSVVQELNLLSSDIGRMALSTTVICDVVGMTGVVAFEAAKQGEGRNLAPLWYMISLVILTSTIIGGFRLVMERIVKSTPEGKPVEQAYIIAILLAVMVVGFLTDFFGLAIANGPLWLGLAVPDGPPLGATLVQKCESFIMDILMPFTFTYVGLLTDVHSMSDQWSNVEPLLFMVLTGYVAKFFSTLLFTRFCEMPLKDGIALSLLMSLRGQVEILFFLHWLDLKMIKIPQFTMMVLLTTMITGIATPLINVVYNPNKPYMLNKRRTVQHTPSSTGLHIVVCYHDEESMLGVLQVIQLCNPTVQSPFSIFALHLVELVGRAAPVFIDHTEEDEASGDASNNGSSSRSNIQNALHAFQEARKHIMKIYPFTSIAPKRSMYQDICELALDRKANLIILPYHDSLTSLAGTNMVQKSAKSLNTTVLDHTPCSVAVVLDKGRVRTTYGSATGTSMTRVRLHFAVLFLGGPDAREALACADRMAGNSNVFLTVVRFFSYNGEGDDELEKKLDDGMMTAFWVKNEGNKNVVYKEVVVRNGNETVAAIQAMNHEFYHLWIVGRKYGINPVLIQGLTTWSENPELGVIGDYVASPDLGSSASVFVVQQQILRDEVMNSDGLQGRISRYVTHRLPCF